MAAVQAIVLLVGGLLTIALVILAIKVARGNRVEYDRNRSRTPSLMKAARGEIPTKFDGGHDHRVAAGVAVDRDRNTLIDQGRLSEEALANLVQRHP